MVPEGTRAPCGSLSVRMRTRTRSLSGGRLAVTWADAKGRAFFLAATLDSAWLTNPREQHLDARTITDSTFAEIRAWASSRGVAVTLRSEGGKIQVSAQGPEQRMRVVAQELEGAVEDAKKRALRACGFMPAPDGSPMPDFSAAVRRCTARLQPLVTAILECNDDRSYLAFASRTLSFVQSIPYVVSPETLLMPAGVLRMDRGDCDDKTLLFLSLLKSCFPDIACAAVCIPEHCFAALPVEVMPDRIRIQGRSWALCEPAGPAVTAIGKAGERTLKAVRTGAANAQLII